MGWNNNLEDTLMDSIGKALALPYEEKGLRMYFEKLPVVWVDGCVNFMDLIILVLNSHRIMWDGIAPTQQY